MKTWLTLSLLAATVAAGEDLRCWLPKNRKAQLEFESRLVAAVNPQRLAAAHAVLAARPHRAGSPGDLALVANLAKSFRELGLEVEEQEIWCYLAVPVSGELEVVAPERVSVLTPMPFGRVKVASSAGPSASPGWPVPASTANDPSRRRRNT